MTPKEKAKELFEMFFWKAVRTGKQAKASALIAVDEILKNDSVGISYDNNFLICDTDYWQQVKQAIEEL